MSPQWGTDGRPPSSQDNDAEHRADDDDRASRGWVIAAVVLSLMAAASLGGVGWLLLAPSNERKVEEDVLACVPSRDFRSHVETSAKCPPKGAHKEVGIVGRFERGVVEITTLQGQHFEYSVRGPDQKYIDVAHAQSHAALGQPVEVYTRKHEDQTIVVYMQDPPIGL